MDKVGKIYGEVINEKFTFASKEFFEGNFVMIVDDEENENPVELVCEVVSKGISNRFLSTPEIVKYLDDNMDYQRDTIYTYSAVDIGTIKEKEITREKVVALPGKNVYSAEPDALKTVFGIEDGKLKIGFLKKMPLCSMTMDSKTIFNPHLFIVGKTGSGKSYFVKKFISNIDESFWIFSPSNEYNNIMTKMKSEKHSEFVLDLNVDNISYYVNLNASEEIILRSINFEANKIYSYKEIISEIYEHYKKKKSGKIEQLTLDLGENYSQEIELPSYANSLIGKLKSLRSLKFTKDSKAHPVPKSSVIFNLEEYSQLEQECILNYYLYKLLQRCKKTKEENRKKHIIVIEEAHNYVPSIRSTLCKDIIVRLSREGRKYGISLCFITQRPRFFDQTALSQSGNKMIFSLSNPDDVKHVMEDIAFYKPEFAMQIQKQKVGECIVAGDAYNDALEVVIEF